MTVKVYFASKTCHAPKWIGLRAAWQDRIHFVARWPYMVGVVPATDPVAAQNFWQDDMLDVSTADVVIVYVEPGEHLRGALVEAGMALAYDNWVIVVGNSPDYGTWQYHPKVRQADTIDQALTLATQLVDEI